MNTMFLEICKASSQNSLKIYINSNPVLKMKENIIFTKMVFLVHEIAISSVALVSVLIYL